MYVFVIIFLVSTYTLVNQRLDLDDMLGDAKVGQNSSSTFETVSTVTDWRRSHHGLREVVLVGTELRPGELDRSSQ